MSLLQNVLRARGKSLALRSKGTFPVRSHSIVPASKKMKKIKEIQAAMQCDDGVPVYLKKGTPDKLLYRFTLFLMAVGGIDCASFLWRWAKRP